MKHLRKFEKYTSTRRKNELIKESVLQVNDIYKVRTFIDIPQSLINAYVKKVKDTAGKNLRQFFGDVDIAEEIVKYINLNYLNVDKIPAGALMGDGQAQPQTDSQVSEEPVQAQTQNSTETEEPKSEETKEQPQVQVQAQSENFEEVSGDEGEEKPKEEETKEEVQSKEEETKEEVQSKEEETKEEGGSEELPV